MRPSDVPTTPADMDWWGWARRQTPPQPVWCTLLTCLRTHRASLYPAFFLDTGAMPGADGAGPPADAAPDALRGGSAGSASTTADTSCQPGSSAAPPEQPGAVPGAAGAADASGRGAGSEQAAQGPAEPAVRFLDVGCGFGGLLVRLSPLFPDTLMLGMELRDKACPAATRLAAHCCESGVSAIDPIEGAKQLHAAAVY